VSISYPISLADLFGSLAIVSAVMAPRDPRVGLQTRGGGGNDMNVGHALFEGQVTVRPYYTQENREVETRVNLLKDAGATFLVTDGRQVGPALDPDGSILGASSVTLTSIDAGKRMIDLSGLPSGYDLSIGDLLSFQFGSGQYSLHQVARAATATGGGSISDLDIFPRVPQAAVSGVSVDLTNPTCKARMIPGGMTPATHLLVVSGGISFSWEQVLR